MENYSNFTTRNCNVPCCNGQHFIKFKPGKAVVPVCELFEIERHWRKNIEKLCGKVCSDNNLCKLHRKLDCFLFFTGNIKQRNIERNDVVSKIRIEVNCRHPLCMNSWCFSIHETEYITNDKTLSYRATRFLQSAVVIILKI